MRAACVTPRLQAKRFEETILGQLRDHILTESNIRDLVGMLDEEMDGVAREQRQNLETIEAELEDVRRRLSGVWQVVENTDLEVADASERIKEHRDRQQRLEIHADEARAMLAERRVLLDSAETVAAFAEEMSEFLRTSEITETRAFVRSFAKGDPGAARAGHDPLHDPDAAGQSPARRQDRRVSPRRPGTVYRQVRLILVGRTGQNQELPHARSSHPPPASGSCTSVRPRRP